ncbi:hypothetical protein IQK56_16040 [Pseudomonas sp. MAFF 301449]|uniref:Uncharacterized protein n=1 Tax=Pseudomonas cyclaminis TaxID=2781239 RepID=A0ABR9STY7_9PSED|nr:hypothetical protein [Pseudomonas cyclaminis]MBE8592323.1 hypothetical protein [Pseudomonas cyclaminis]MBE8600024.1 hypothetical protein [Pseudomonas cyclaminis]
MSSIGSSSFSPAMQANETGACASKENQAEEVNKKRKQEEEEEEDKDKPVTTFRDADGATYKIEDGQKLLIAKAPTAEDQITF